MKTTILLLLISINTFTQSFDRQDAVFATYNVLSGGIISGVGAVINRQDNTKVAKAFVNGFKKGCVGGAFCYAGKKMTGRIAVDKSYLWGWPANIVHSLGTSIIENGCMNKGMFSRYSIDVYCFNFATDNKYGAKINPVNLSGNVFYAFKYDLNVKKSLECGVFYTDFNDNSKDRGNNLFNSISVRNNDLHDYNYDYDGIIPSHIKYSTPYINNYDVTAHEMIHTFQFNSINIINCYDKINANSNFFDFKIPYFEIPYFFDKNINGYSNSFFESEASFNL